MCRRRWGVSRTETKTEQRLAAVVVSVSAVKLPSSTFTRTLPSLLFE
jgi:hypothetical protein